MRREWVVAMVGRRRAAKSLLQIANAASRHPPASPSFQIPGSLPECTAQQSHCVSQNGAWVRSIWSWSFRKTVTDSKPALRGSPAPSTVAANRSGTARGLATAATAPLPAQAPWYGRYVGYTLLLGGSAILTYYYYPHPQKGARAARPSVPLDEHTVTNWSGTHSATTRVYVQPESLEELEGVVKLAHQHGQRIRPVGSGLSPNGIGLSEEGMINLALMDKVLSVDEETKRVRVQAGARVAEVVEALRPHGLTLQNYASIREQQIGGFIQVGFSFLSSCLCSAHSLLESETGLRFGLGLEPEECLLFFSM